VAGCIVPRLKSHLELLKIGLAPFDWCQALQAQMGPLM